MDKGAALERDEADTATARTTVLIEKINIAEILPNELRTGTNFCVFPALWQAEQRSRAAYDLP